MLYTRFLSIQLALGPNMSFVQCGHSKICPHTYVYRCYIYYREQMWWSIWLFVLIVCFVDIGGIYDHHFLNFCFITYSDDILNVNFFISFITHLILTQWVLYKHKFYNNFKQDSDIIRPWLFFLCVPEIKKKKLPQVMYCILHYILSALKWET